MSDESTVATTPEITDRTRRRYALSEALPLIERTPAVLNTLLRGLPDGWIAAHEGGASWSPFDVLGHLIHGEQTDWIQRVQRIMESGDTRAFEPFDRFAQANESEGKTLAQLLDEFARLRAGNIQAIREMNLTEADLDRPGKHPSLGPVTLRALLATWVVHDLDHIFQITRVIATQYADEVGPWKQYLRILSGKQG